jgi:hypothetical protein
MLVAIIAAGNVHAAVRTPEEVIRHHVAAFRQGDVGSLLSDYAGNAVAVEKTGVFAGTAQLRSMFEFFSDEANMPGRSTFEATIETLRDDVLVEHWVVFRGTPQHNSGDDLFVVRHGKIVFQAKPHIVPVRPAAGT